MIRRLVQRAVLRWKLEWLHRCPKDPNRKCDWVLITREEFDWFHMCNAMSYCHHYPVECERCGRFETHGDSVPEVR